MVKKVVNHKPKEYLKQGMRHCGGYTIKAILSAYDLDDGRHPKKYLLPKIKSLGFTTPKLIQETLKRYGFDAPIKRANKFSNDKKIQSIKQELDKNNPVILLIGNGYSQTGNYSEFRMNWVSHWITVWGYDDKKKTFFIYDSYVDQKSYDRIPVGNVKRTYEQVLRDWKGAFYFRMKSFLYIPVMKR
ncbi:C39 family peptidase [Candidatus Woesearchaeota archaeon]|nr:C39 family peptidase [Candidatus Woesearchaeota archaeon]